MDRILPRKERGFFHLLEHEVDPEVRAILRLGKLLSKDLFFLGAKSVHAVHPTPDDEIDLTICRNKGLRHRLTWIPLTSYISRFTPL